MTAGIWHYFLCFMWIASTPHHAAPQPHNNVLAQKLLSRVHRTFTDIILEEADRRLAAQEREIRRKPNTSTADTFITEANGTHITTHHNSSSTESPQIKSTDVKRLQTSESNSSVPQSTKIDKIEESSFLGRVLHSPYASNDGIPNYKNTLSSEERQNYVNNMLSQRNQKRVVIIPSPSPEQTIIKQLVLGSMQETSGGFELVPSITLIRDGGITVVVDTPAPTDNEAIQQMLEELAHNEVRPEEVDILVTTHGHPDHSGYSSIFQNANHFFGIYEFTGRTFTMTEIADNGTMPLSANIDLMSTPGHTTSDISVIVREVPALGTVGVVGDLFYSANDAIDPRIWLAGAVDRRGIVFREKVLCAVDYVIPGHGAMFQVTAEMRPSSDRTPLATKNNLVGNDHIMAVKYDVREETIDAVKFIKP